MEKSNNSNIPPIILDSDVLTSWITKETETTTGKELWTSPLKIITLIEKKKITGWVSLTSLLEIRFLLRRKKKCSENIIKSFFEEFTKLFEIIVPDEIELLRSNQLQDKFLLDPFDAVLLATALTKENIILITRDRTFISIASRLIEATTPEKFLENNFPSI